MYYSDHESPPLYPIPNHMNSAYNLRHYLSLSLLLSNFLRLFLSSDVFLSGFMAEVSFYDEYRHPVVTLCRSSRTRNFGGTYRLRLQYRKISQARHQRSRQQDQIFSCLSYSWTLTTDAICSSDTSVSLRTTGHYIHKIFLPYFPYF
jgi:hypothetical protein